MNPIIWMILQLRILSNLFNLISEIRILVWIFDCIRCLLRYLFLILMNTEIRSPNIGRWLLPCNRKCDYIWNANYCINTFCFCAAVLWQVLVLSNKKICLIHMRFICIPYSVSPWYTIQTSAWHLLLLVKGLFGECYFVMYKIMFANNNHKTRYLDQSQETAETNGDSNDTLHRWKITSSDKNMTGHIFHWHSSQEDLGICVKDVVNMIIGSGRKYFKHKGINHVK